MNRQQAWQKIKKLCPNIEESDKLAWQLKQNKQWILSNHAVQKIAAYNEIFVTYGEPQEIMGNIYIKATAKNTKTGLQIESFGETSSKNTHNAYPIAMAEKRAFDRVVLKCVDIYSDFYSDIESEDFNNQPSKNYKQHSADNQYDGFMLEIQMIETQEDFDSKWEDLRNRIKESDIDKEQKKTLHETIIDKFTINNQ
tara:strand:- start:5387 stop:5977 length:591 start_codon:yes stop_codon:yes gene_type:complete